MKQSSEWNGQVRDLIYSLLLAGNNSLSLTDHNFECSTNTPPWIRATSFMRRPIEGQGCNTSPACPPGAAPRHSSISDPTQHAWLPLIQILKVLFYNLHEPALKLHLIQDQSKPGPGLGLDQTYTNRTLRRKEDTGFINPVLGYSYDNWFNVYFEKKNTRS